ncbi:hypothetical protein CGJ72_24095 [Vibrio parahaemolyticus]|nr:hypothetical protein CGJ72_24095 [Vibrio parahaemolyticus]TOD07436.1 hypothetical protein CGJ70_24375 [Vibrio parahaemolyticus]
MTLTSELMNSVSPFHLLPSPKETLSVMFNIYISITTHLYLPITIIIQIYYISKIKTHLVFTKKQQVSLLYEQEEYAHDKS